MVGLRGFVGGFDHPEDVEQPAFFAFAVCLAPVAMLAMGKIWTYASSEAWATSRGRTFHAEAFGDVEAPADT